MTDRCFVNSIAQVSCQKPLSDEWFDQPCFNQTEYVRATEPDVKGLIPPAEARRMSRILKRSVATALKSLHDAGIDVPDAIVTGTGMGCMENSEKFLTDMSKFGENCLKPTLFMQSTHNTVSSLIAILLKCHGYNNTYSHKGISFESALFDAWLRIRTGRTANVLVGAHDEVTPLMSRIMKRTHPEYSLVSEASVSAMLSSVTGHDSLCEVKDVRIMHNPDMQYIASLLNKDTDSLVMLGINGNPLNDDCYRNLIDALDYDPRILRYRHLFGDSFSSSALGFYAAATIIARQHVPDFLSYTEGEPYTFGEIDYVTIINHCDGTDWSLVRLARIRN